MDTLTQQEFLRRARKVHGNRYDYSRAFYKHAHKPVVVICRTHGAFAQRSYAHLTGEGCPACGLVRKRDKSTAARRNR